MEDLEKKQKETRMLLKAVLMPHKTGLIIKDLEKTYFDFENRPIPYRSFGFGDLVSYLESIPETVQVEKLATGDFLIRARADERDKHVAKLVACQVTKSKLTGVAKQTAIALKEEGRMRRQKLRTVPYDFQQDILHLVRQYPQGIDLREFEFKYRRKYNRAICPSDFGYNSVLELASSLNNIITIRKPSQGTVLILPKEEFFDQHASRNQNYQQNVQKQQFFKGKQNYQQTDQKQTSFGGKQNFPRRPDTYGSEETTTKPEEKSRSNLPLGKQTEENLRKIIERYPDGVPVTKLPSIYEQNYKKILDYRDFNCVSIMELCYRLPEIFYVRDGSSPVMAFPATVGVNSVQLSENSTCSRDLKPSSRYYDSKTLLNIPDDVILNLKKILIEHPENMTDCQLLDKYRLRSGKSLNVKQYNAESLEHFLMSDQLGFLTVTKHRDPMSVSGFWLSVEMRPNFLSRLKTEVLSVTEKEFFFGTNDSIPPLKVPKDLDKNEWIDLIVAEVIALDKFFIQLVGEDTTDKLNTLMEDLNDFYFDPDNNSKYKMPLHSMLVSSFCACLFKDDNWHRGFITKIVSVQVCEVSYIDYGTTAKVGIDQIRFLDRKFAELPSQAIPACLNGLKPPNSEPKFSREAAKCFLNLCNSLAEQGLTAQFRGIIKDMQCQRQSLCIRGKSINNYENGVDIGFELVKAGYAVQDCNSSQNSSLETKVKRRVLSGPPAATPPPVQQLQPLHHVPFPPGIFGQVPCNQNPPGTTSSSGFYPQHNFQQQQYLPQPIMMQQPLGGFQGPGLIPQPVFDPYMQQQQPISYQMPAPLLVPQNSNVAEGLYTLSLAHSPSHMSTTSLSKPFVPSLSKSFASLPLNHSLASGSDGTSDQISGNSRSIFHDLAKTSKEFVPRIQSPKDNTTNTSSQKSSTIRETSLGHGKRFDPSKPLFREVRLTTDGDLIHVANISGRPMVLSAEISGLIPRWNGDILGKMLKVIGEQKLTQVYKRDESTVELFQQCLIHSLPGICIGDTDDIVDSLTFYRLADVPRILQKFKPQLKTELYQAVMREIENFDPNDLYWSGEQEI